MLGLQSRLISININQGLLHLDALLVIKYLISRTNMSSKLFYYSDNGQDQFCYLIFKTQYFTIIKEKGFKK